MRAALARLCGVVLVVGCGGQPDQPTGVPTWEVSSSPTLSVGDQVDTDTMVFARVTDARLTDTGLLLVADGRASVIVVFDTSGAERARLGQQGRGPGEFTGAMTLAGLSGDSIAVWDAGQSRWTLLSGAQPSIDPSARIEGPSAWMHAGVLVRSERSLVPTWTAPLLLRLADSLPEMRLGFLDETSLLWVNTDASGREWQAYAGANAVGRITLPAAMQPMQFRADAVVGVQSDSLGLERVVVYSLGRPSGVAPDQTPATAPAPDSIARSELIAAMRTTVMAQEMHYATASSYTTGTDSLNVVMPEGTRFRVLHADDRGWSGVGYFNATGFSCGMVVGGISPRGWSEGAVRCGW